MLHTVFGVGPTSFGLGQVALNLAKEQSVLGFDTQIWCLDNPGDIPWASESSGLSESRIAGFSVFGPRMLMLTPHMERAAAGPDGKTFDIVHQHGIWTGVSRVTNVLRQKHGLLSVVAPHGALSPWALNLSSWKKKIALATYEGRNLNNASCLHALSEMEITDFRDFGLKNPIALISNGISEKWLHAEGSADRFRSQYGVSEQNRILFFLSRITPKKGLPMLIEAISNLKNDFAGWQLIIAGTDEFGHKAEVETLIDKFNLQDNISIIGPLYDQAKCDAVAAADLFILPSYSEGAPLVILDCLAAGVPIITTKASPWEELDTHDCGWWVDVSVHALCNALRQALPLSRSQLKEMGLRGKRLVAAKYTWAGKAQKTIELYNWLLGRIDKPDFVVLD